MVGLRRGRIGALAYTLAGTGLVPMHAWARPDPCADTPCGRLTLRIRAKGDRVARADARVVALPSPQGAVVGPLQPPPPLPEPKTSWQREGTTDARGIVELVVPRTLIRVVVLAPGGDSYEAIVDARASAARNGVHTLYIPSGDMFRTVVDGSSGPPRANAAAQTLTREEIRTLPGSQGDPLRALQNLPGVGRTPGNLGLLILRGAAPDQSRVYLGGHALPRAFHVLSVSSVFPAEVLDELKLVPGNFDAAYGNATGGVVVIEPRAGRRDGLHGFTEVDLAAASTMLEGPLKRGSFIVGAQRGYADLLLAAADGLQRSVTGEAGNITRPTYYDYQALLDFPLRGSTPGSWSIRVFGAGDRLRSVAPVQSSFDSSFDYRTAFHRVDAAIRARADGWRFWWTPSFRVETGRLELSPADSDQRRQDYVISTRAELSKRLTRRFSWLLGTDLELGGFRTRSRVENTSLAMPNAPPIVERDDGLTTNLGVYTTANLQAGWLELVPGVRASSFSVAEQSAFSFDPRVVGSAELSPSWTLRAGVGKYSQPRAVTETETIELLNQGDFLGGGSVFYPPVFTRFDPTVGFAVGDRQLTVREALHASFTAQFRPSRPIDSDRDEWDIQATAFAREQNNATPVVFDGNVVGFSTREYNIGLQALIRRRISNKVYGWVAYTLMWSRLRFFDLPPQSESLDRPSDFDQRHNFNAVLSYLLPKNWRLGGRFRVVTGFPYTPVVGSINLTNNRAAVLAPRNSGRLDTFHQLDIRVDKRWIRDRAIVTGYVDIQNVYNRQNPEAVLYDVNFREQQGPVGIPIFPAIGVRVDY